MTKQAEQRAAGPRAQPWKQEAGPGAHQTSQSAGMNYGSSESSSKAAGKAAGGRADDQRASGDRNQSESLPQILLVEIASTVADGMGF